MNSKIVEKLLRHAGFELRRTKKHQVYRRPDGKTFVRASTPSDVRGERNNFADLCHVIGITKAEAMDSLKRRRKHESTTEVALQFPPQEINRPEPEPVAPAATPMSRDDRRLAKRLERIERNTAAKRAKFDAKWAQFVKGNAILYVATNEFVFLRHPHTVEHLRDMLDCIEKAGSDSIAADILAGRQMDTTPEMIVHLTEDGDRLSFIFDDGSAVSGRLDKPLQRMARGHEMSVKRKAQ